MPYPDPNLEQNRARKRLQYAVKTGKIVRPKVCSRCSKEGVIDAHHEDYSKPLDVTWICRRCHNIENARRRRLNHPQSPQLKEPRKKREATIYDFVCPDCGNIRKRPLAYAAFRAKNKQGKIVSRCSPCDLASRRRWEHRQVLKVMKQKEIDEQRGLTDEEKRRRLYET